MRSLAAGLMCVLGMLIAPSAQAAFAGRSGELAVQPLIGGGLVLLGAHGGPQHRVCGGLALCGEPVGPRWSPDGRELVFADQARSRLEVITAGGTCLWCLMPSALSSGAPLTAVPGTDPSFSPDGGSITFVGAGAPANRGLWTLELGATKARRVLSGEISSATWSSKGMLAVVRHGSVWIGPSAGRLRRLARGGAVSWSPSGSRLAVARGGWIYLVAVKGASSHRLANGGLPAWSPDGSALAYIGAGHRVEVERITGGRPRAVGQLRARSVDWRPLRVDPARRA